MRAAAWLVSTAMLATASCAARPTQRPTTAVAIRREPLVVDAGRLRLLVSISRTAQIFHIVDQLSGWSQFSHAQYRNHPPPGTRGPRERELLAVHAALRAGRGWGGGFEQAFYVDDDLDAAATSAVSRGLLTPDEVRIELTVLQHFAPLLDPFIAGSDARLRQFAQRLLSRPEALRALAGQLAVFVQMDRPVLDVYAFLIASPADRGSGGGMNGGRLTFEVPRIEASESTLMHEVLHAFLALRRPDIDRAAALGAGLDGETLEEGIAYALAPGIFNSHDGIDELARQIAEDVASGRTLENTFLRYRRLAFELRPPLVAALRDGTSLDAFLPVAVEAWARVRERATREMVGGTSSAPPQ